MMDNTLFEHIYECALTGRNRLILTAPLRKRGGVCRYYNTGKEILDQENVF